MANPLTSFQFDPTQAAGNSAFTNFNNLIGQGNVNGAYSQLFAGPNGSANAAAFQSAYGNPNQANQIINSFTAGGGPSDFASQGYGYQEGSQYAGMTPAQIQAAYPGTSDSAARMQANMSALGQQSNINMQNRANDPNVSAAMGGAGAMQNQAGGVGPMTGTVGTVDPSTGITGNGMAPAGGSTPNPAGTTLSALANPSSNSANPFAPNSPAMSGPTAGPGDYEVPGTNVSSYLDPSMAFTEQQGMNAINNSAAAGGSLQSGQTLKDIANYTTGLASQNYQNAFNNQQTDLNRMYGVANNDQNFAYNAQNNDRNYNTNLAESLAGSGLQATNSQSQLQAILAQLISGNTVAGGIAQGTGTIGAGNQLSTALQQILTQMYGNNVLTNLKPTIAGGINPTGGG